jgi:hypothetical protein
LNEGGAADHTAAYLTGLFFIDQARTLRSMARASSPPTTAAAIAPTLLPAWANAENRALHQRIECAALQLREATARVEGDAARADAMRHALHQLNMQLRGCQV